MNWYKKAQSDRILYHVTHTRHVPAIEERGILPMQTSNWVQEQSRERYGEGEVFSFESLRDAMRWAAKMDWEFNKQMGSGEISIVEFREGDEWEIDEADPLSQAGGEGAWLKRIKRVYPEDIIKSYPFTVEMAKSLV